MIVPGSVSAMMLGGEYIIRISANTNNVNLKTLLLSKGWSGLNSVRATIYVDAGVTVGSTSVTTPSMITDVSYPSGSVLTLVNNGIISGKGGNGASPEWTSLSQGYFNPATYPPQNGGTAIKADTILRVINNGTIAGGGGGGAGRSGYIYKVAYSQAAAVAGGGGAGSTPGTGGATASSATPYTESASGQDTNYYADTSTYYNTTATAANGTSTLGGVGRGLTNFDVSACSGGNLGMPGGDGYYCTWPPDGVAYNYYAGGLAGKYAENNSNITWLVNGTRLGGTS